MATNLVLSAIVPEVLREDNYENWRVCVRQYLLDQDLWDIVEIKSKPGTDDDTFNSWKLKNAMALRAIKNSCGPNMLSEIKGSRSAKEAWDFLANNYRPQLQGVSEPGSSFSQPSISVVERHKKPVNSVGDSGMKTSEYAKYLPLVEALEIGNYDAVKDFLDCHQNVLGKRLTSEGLTALQLAVFYKHVKIVEALGPLMSEQDLEIQDNNGWTALHFAMIDGHVKIAEVLMQSMSKQGLAIKNNRSLTALHLAVSRGHVKIAEELARLMSEQDLTIQNDSGWTALHYAADGGHEKIVEAFVSLMLEHDIAIQDNNSLTALHLAVSSGHVKIAEELVRSMSKQDLAIQNNSGWTALHYAVNSGHEKIVETLVSLMLEHDLAIQDNGSFTALHYTVSKGHVKIAEVLMRSMSKQDLAMQNVDGWTALHFAADNGHAKIVEALVPLMSEQDLAKQNNNSSTALHFAVSRGHVEIVEALVQLISKQDLAIQTNRGWTALHYAADGGHVKIVEALVPLMLEHDLALQNNSGWTALHSAVVGGCVEIAEELVQSMSKQDLEIQDNDGWTALMFAAARGFNLMIACMVERNENLVRVKDKRGRIPVVQASIKGRNDTVHYLYTRTPREELTGENKINGATLLSYCIISKMFDVAVDLLQRCPHLAFALDVDGNSPVFVLSGMPTVFHSGSRLGFWQRCIYSCIRVQPTPTFNYIGIDIEETDQGQTNRVSIITRVFGQLHGLLSYLLKLLGIKELYDRKFMHVQALQISDIIFKRMPVLNGFEEKLAHKALFRATKGGIVELIMKLAKFNPAYLILINDSNTNRGLLQHAIIHRQEKIWSLVYEFNAHNDTLVSRCDLFQNNLLHLAGMLAPSTRLDRISGAALQMQRELQWFEEVESFVSPMCKEMPNSDDKTARELFTEEHRELVKEGQKWMKETATSCAFVAALIVTIMFTAAFTVPGGSNQDTGFPIFSEKKLFKAFIVCDAISFLSATTSIIIFLGILTSRYGEEDFLESLPNKMIVGLATLFISIATMIIAFCATLSLMLHGQMLGTFILVLVLACMPVIIFVILQFPLFIEILISTYRPNLFKRNQTSS